MITRKGQKMKNGRMTDDERARIADLAAQGKTAMQIAVALGRSFGTINSHIHRNRGQIQVAKSYAFWSFDDDAVLHEMVRSGASDAAIGEAIGRSANAVHSRLMYLGGRDLILYPQGVARKQPTIKPNPSAKTDQSLYIAWRIAMARAGRISGS